MPSVLSWQIFDYSRDLKWHVEQGWDTSERDFLDMKVMCASGAVPNDHQVFAGELAVIIRVMYIQEAYNNVTV